MAKYYVRRLRWGSELGEQFWRIDGHEARQIDVVSHAGLSTFHREPGETVEAILDRIMRGGDWYELSLRPGEYFPRMARPNSINQPGPGHNPDATDEFRHYRARSAGQLHAFVEDLDHICRVIHPDGRNLCAFGHATRNLLILACTEVEAHWRKILQDNGYKGPKRTDRYTTSDYVHLLPAMRLDQYVVNLNYYPWLLTVAPFEGWEQSSPSESLPWYEAYNLVKHDREGQFAKATLHRAITAVAACFVMLCAQYGWDFALLGEEAERAFFKLVKGPDWAPSEIYVPPYEGTYRAIHYPFAA